MQSCISSAAPQFGQRHFALVPKLDRWRIVVTAEPDKSPQLPAPDQRMPVTRIVGPHPATLGSDQLLEQCDLRTQRRSGPGGQHRNKTSSGVFLHHEPTGVVGEATERRSQSDNRSIALTRLRLRLAVEVRTDSVLDGFVSGAEAEWRAAYVGNLRIGERNAARPAVLALILNDLHAAGGQPSVVAKRWKASTSAVTRLLKSHPPAFALVNAIRKHHGRGPLK